MPAGFVSGLKYIGGLVGYHFGNTNIRNSYWTIDTLGDMRSTYGEGKSRDSMQSLSAYDNWDFHSIWAIDESSNDASQRINYGYPYLLCVGGQAGYSFCTAAE